VAPHRKCHPGQPSTQHAQTLVSATFCLNWVDENLPTAVPDLRYLECGDLGNPTRTEGVRAYWRFLCICELRRAGADTGE